MQAPGQLAQPGQPPPVIDVDEKVCAMPPTISDSVLHA
jgi:hypothetical protein